MIRGSEGSGCKGAKDYVDFNHNGAKDGFENLFKGLFF